MNKSREQNASDRCPNCGRPGKPVKRVTLESLLRPEARRRLPAEAAWRFCTNPDCATAYFAGPDAPVFDKSDLTVRVGIKEREAPRPVCYCFNHTIEEIEDAVQRTGKTTVLDDIKTRMKEACWCETKSPLGSCCLSTVTAHVKAALEKYGAPAQPGSSGSDDCCSPGGGTTDSSGDCCQTHAPASKADATQSSRRLEKIGLLSLVGSVLAALLASACCWLPLLLLAFGVSGLGLSAAFEPYRPWFTVLTFIFLGTAFYFAYRPRRAGVPGDQACCATAVPGRRTFQKVNRIVLWFATALALAFLFFPNYVGALLGCGETDGMDPSLQRLVMTVEGMDCPACAAGLAARLKTVSGVRMVRVNYENKQVVLGVVRDTPAPRVKILEAIREAGFEGRFPDAANTNPAG